MTRVLVVDDSAVVRKALTQELARDPEIEVVGAASDPYVARDLIARTHPHVLTLDIDMPRMDGLTFLEKLMHHCPLPVVIVSSLTPRGSRMALQALELGAIDVISKPESAYAVGDMGAQLARTIKAAALIDVRKLAPAMTAKPRSPIALTGAPAHRIVAIGGSTGGTRAIAEIVRRFPANGPATIIVQHMPPGFTRAFAQRLDQLSEMNIREACAGDALECGLALVAPGDHHLTIERVCGRTLVVLRDGPRVHFQRPSVEVLFDSVAETAGAEAVGILLTGMGADGAQGLLRMRRAGASTIAQDEATSVVFGMPREAILCGAAEQVLGLPVIADAALELSARRRAA